MAAQPGEGGDELSRLQEAADKAGAEFNRLNFQWFRMNDEVDSLQRRLNMSKQDEEKKDIEGQLMKTITKRDLAEAKRRKAFTLWRQRESEEMRAELVIKSGDTSEVDNDIRKLKEEVVEWEEEIKQQQLLLLEIEQDEGGERISADSDLETSETTSQSIKFEQTRSLASSLTDMEEIVEESNNDLRVTKIEGYTCVRRSVLCLVYLPDTVPQLDVDIQSTSDSTVYPKTSANEILLTPVVSITSQSQTLAMDKPVVIELMKTVEVNVVGDNKIVPMFSDTDDSIPPNWEDLHEECEVLDDRFRFTTTHFTYFAVVARFSPPTASVMVNPETDFDHELTVREFPGFSVIIPSKSVPSRIEAKATLYYDESEKWKGSANERLASACVRLEPEGQKFSEKVSVNLPIPGYSEIIATNPGAKPQLMYSPNGSSNNWEMYDMEIVKVDGEFVARFSTDHFSDWRLSWAENVQEVAKAIGTIFRRVTSLRCRCQVFMSRETEVGSVLTFSVQGLVYQFQDPPQEIPRNYHYMLHDSDRLPIRVTPGELSFTLELKDHLIPDNEDESRFEDRRQLSHDSPARPKFYIKLNKESKTLLKKGAVFADFSVNNSDGLIHDCNLIKPSQMEVSDRHQLAPSDVKTVSSELNKVVKSGPITDPDRLLNDLSAYIYDKYTEIGIELGLDYRVLRNELETGEFTMHQGSKKALKMLQLWRNSVKEDNFTYAVLAAALEKHGFGHCANKYCYTSIGNIESEDGAGLPESSLKNTEDKKRVTDHEEPPTTGRRISRWCSCNCFK